MLSREERRKQRKLKREQKKLAKAKIKAFRASCKVTIDGVTYTRCASMDKIIYNSFDIMDGSSDDPRL